MIDGTFHNFQASKWLQPLSRPMKGEFRKLGGVYQGVPITDEIDGPIDDETQATTGSYILEDGPYSGQP